MRVHHNGVMSSVYDLPGGGPQGALLTVLLFNLNSNWLTDVCQPGIMAESRFLGECVPVTAPRDASAQRRDCPPAVFPPFEHMGLHCCPYYPPCAHAIPLDIAESVLSNEDLPGFEVVEASLVQYV